MSDGFVWRSSGRDAERMIIIGATGSGKTTKARELVEAARRGGALVIWFDVKGMNDPGYEVYSATQVGGNPQALAKLLQDEEGNGAITVQIDPFGDSGEQLDQVAMSVYLMGNCLFVIDDAMGVQETKPSRWVHNIITMGRARGIGFLSIVQRAHWIPQVFLSEAEHIIAFELHGEADTDRLAKVGARELEGARDLSRWEYLWYSRRDRLVVACEPMALSAPSAT